MVSKRSQVSETTDNKLKEHSHIIGTADGAIEIATKHKTEAWDAILEIFDELSFTGPFYTEEGRTLMLQPRAGGTKLDQEKLERLMRENLGNRFNGLWNSITTKTVDATLLDRMVRTGKIPGDMVDQCIEQKPSTFARIRREFTKEDTEKAKMLYGIEIG